jgi:hypothetical protein
MYADWELLGPENWAEGTTPAVKTLETASAQTAHVFPTRFLIR